MAHSLEIVDRNFHDSNEFGTTNNINAQIAMVAHDVRNPLACIISTLELIDDLASQDCKSDIGSVICRGLRAADRIDEMMQGLLDAQNMHGDDGDCVLPEYNLMRIIEKAIDQNSFSAKRKNISFKLMGSEIYLRVDERLLFEAIDNLISNAIKYSYPRGEIICEIEQKFGFTYIHVLDRGRGLTHADLGRIRRPFQKLSARPTADEKSTGLGLWVVHRITKKLNGQFFAESKGTDRGAKFTLRLPQMRSRD